MLSAAEARILDALETVIYLNNYFGIQVCAQRRARSTAFVHKLIINLQLFFQPLSFILHACPLVYFHHVVFLLPSS